MCCAEGEWSNIGSEDITCFWFCFHAVLLCSLPSLLKYLGDILITGWDPPLLFSAHTLTKDLLCTKHCAGWMFGGPEKNETQPACMLLHGSAWLHLPGLSVFLFSWLFSSCVDSFCRDAFEHVLDDVVWRNLIWPALCSPPSHLFFSLLLSC